MLLLQPSACLRGGGRVTAGARRDFSLRGWAGVWVGVSGSPRGAVTHLVPPGTGNQDRVHEQLLPTLSWGIRSCWGKGTGSAALSAQLLSPPQTPPKGSHHTWKFDF